jgi:uncharacterized membrane protein
VREILVTIHLLSVVVWLGAGVYDFFLTRETASGAGQSAELPLTHIHLRYGPVIAVAMFLVFISGILMSALLARLGFFHLDLAWYETVLNACNTRYAHRIRSAYREDYGGCEGSRHQCRFGYGRDSGAHLSR